MEINTRAIFEEEIVNSLLSNNEFFGSSIPYLEKKYFTNGNEIIFDKIKTFYADNGKKPNIKDIILLIKDEPKSKKEEAVKALKKINSSKVHADSDLLLSKTEEYIRNAIRTDALILGAEGMGSNDEKKLLESFALMEDAHKVTLDEDFGLDLDDIESMTNYLNEDYDGLLTGIPSIDKMLGKGIYSKSLTTFLAPPGVGKTAGMIAFLVQFLKQGQDVIFISLEMNEFEVLKRVYANILDIPIQSLDDVDPLVIRQKWDMIKDGLGKLVVKEYPSYSVSSMNIQSFLEKYEQKTDIKKPIVFVDYLGLMNSARLRPGTVNSYEYIKSITAELRSVAQKRDLKIFSAAQLNRGAIGNLEAGQESVADSAGISAFSDCMIFLLQTKEMKQLGEIVMNFEKNRYSGRTYSFKISFNYEHMRFEDLGESSDISKDEMGLPKTQNSFKI